MKMKRKTKKTEKKKKTKLFRSSDYKSGVWHTPPSEMPEWNVYSGFNNHTVFFGRLLEILLSQHWEKPS